MSGDWFDKFLNFDRNIQLREQTKLLEELKQLKKEEMVRMATFERENKMRLALESLMPVINERNRILEKGQDYALKVIKKKKLT